MSQKICKSQTPDGIKEALQKAAEKRERKALKRMCPKIAVKSIKAFMNMANTNPEHMLKGEFTQSDAVQVFGSSANEI